MGDDSCTHPVLHGEMLLQDIGKVALGARWSTIVYHMLIDMLTDSAADA